MYSIKSRLVNALTVIIGAILLVVFLSLDFILDAWVDKQFDEALIEKSNYFKSLIEVESDEIEFEYHKGFMPQFERKEDAQFFQIWSENRTFAKSESLAFFGDVDLKYKDVPTHESRIFKLKLPDGSMGKAISARFQPQLSSEMDPNDIKYIGTMHLTLAISNQKVTNILLFADLSLLFVFLTTIFGMRMVIINVVDRELESLSLLNKEISELDANVIQIKDNPKESQEIAPIRRELNRYLDLNAKIIANEKRLSSDIAHELKTPIAELISLSEMNIRFPDDIRISATYKEDVLSISNNMKNIVNQLMMLNQSGSKSFSLTQQSVQPYPVVEMVMSELAFKYPEIKDRVLLTSPSHLPAVHADKFCMEVIIKNLLDNALFYSTKGSSISVSLCVDHSQNNVELCLSNHSGIALTQENIDHLLQPLYQVDSSRTNTERHGLGLSIVKNLCEINSFSLETTYKTETNEISFTVSFPLIPVKI